jgi:hypothetical protein
MSAALCSLRWERRNAELAICIVSERDDSSARVSGSDNKAMKSLFFPSASIYKRACLDLPCRGDGHL